MNVKFMQMALNEAKKSGIDIPVGCVIEHKGEVLACFSNKKEKLNNPVMHAEICAISEAAKKLKSWRLSGCNLYVTLEPCPMCAFAILNSRIENVYFGAYDEKYGAFGSKINLAEIYPHKINIKGGILEDKCSEVLLEYFKRERQKTKLNGG